jgi:hypothetical protein
LFYGCSPECSCWPAFSQQSSEKTIRITVNLVPVDAVVSDAKGKQVTDLHA